MKNESPFAPMTEPPIEGSPFDAAPFGLLSPDGLRWEDPRKIFRVAVDFKEAPVGPVRLEYWGSRWPNQRLPEDRVPGGGDVGWWELGDWYHGGWRIADATETRDGRRVEFAIQPVNRSEYPDLADYPARFRHTLKIRVASDDPLPEIEAIRAFTDSTWEERAVRISWKGETPSSPQFDAFNGAILGAERLSGGGYRVRVLAARCDDPNSFDKTLVTIQGDQVVTFMVDDLKDGPLLVLSAGIAVSPDEETRDFAALEAERAASGRRSLFDRIQEMPERTWRGAWADFPPKRQLIYLPLGTDGGRQKFRLHADGSVDFRTNNHMLFARPGGETARLREDGANLRFGFGLPDRPNRTLEDDSLPLCVSEWHADGVRIEASAFATPLDGARADGPVPPGDAMTILMIRFSLSNVTGEMKSASLPMDLREGDEPAALRFEPDGSLLSGERFRGFAVADAPPEATESGLIWRFDLSPKETRTIELRIPYVSLDAGEIEKIRTLDFDRERREIAGYWRRRIGEGMRFLTPEPTLNDFFAAHAGHLLINCEREPGSDLRFARVGSFGYGAYSNESCMMVVDLDRRGYYDEARQVLDGWLRYQGTEPLPGDFSSCEGVLYGAGGYEMGGYNQHHGWVLWCLAEHYRFSRDGEWLRSAATGILKGADWIVRERARTLENDDLSKGLLPSGSLEDINDWHPWLSTNCYTWRGLDSAAWALEEISHPEAARIRREADDYHESLLRAFRAASDRSPVVRLRDGTSVPHFPSQVRRRGRSFGWICETLEGAIHLLIARALDPKSPEADWILKDYEDNLYLSNQYGYLPEDLEREWYKWGGMSMQSCLLLEAEPLFDRDDAKAALRAVFNSLAVVYFPDVKMSTEHALPEMGDYKGDHYKSSDEANATGWLRKLFVQEDGDLLRLGAAVPREWLMPGRSCGVEGAETYFGRMSVLYSALPDRIVAMLDGPRRNPPKEIRLRFREPGGRPLESVTANGASWNGIDGEWVVLPGDIGSVTIEAKWG